MFLAMTGQYYACALFNSSSGPCRKSPAATLPPELFGKLPHHERATVAIRRFNGSSTSIDKEREMNGATQMNTRLILTDFAASIMIAVSIGLATSVALA